MRKFLYVFLLLLTISCVFWGCGSEEAGENGEKASSETAQEAKTTEKTKEITEIPEQKDGPDQSASDEIFATVSIPNVYGNSEYFCFNAGEDAAGLFENINKILEKSEKISADKPETAGLSVIFNTDGKEYIFSDLGNDFFSFSENGREEIRESDTGLFSLFFPLYAKAALDKIYDGGEYVLGGKEECEEKLRTLSEDYGRGNFYEEMQFYINDTDYRYYYFDRQGENCYSADVAVKPDNKNGDKLFFDTQYYYFLAGGNAYSSADGINYNKNERYTGKRSLSYLPEAICENYKAAASYMLKREGKELTIEQWNLPERKFFVILGSDGIEGGFYIEDGRLAVMKAYNRETSEIKYEDLVLIAEGSLGNTDPDLNLDSAARTNKYIKEDTEKYGLFDLSGGVIKGREIEPTGVVEEYRHYMSSGSPYTYESIFVGAGRMERRLQSYDGSDYYIANDMILHDDDYNIGSEEIAVGDKVYSGVYYISDELKRDPFDYVYHPRDEYYKCTPELLFDEEYDAELIEAYEATVNGEVYQCEKWSLYLGREYEVYIKDGAIVGYLGDFYKEPVVYTVKRFEKTADAGLIKAPANASERNTED